VYPIGRTAILAISVDALDPQFAADFANAMVEAYLEFKAEERMETSQSTVISLTQQANRLREEAEARGGPGSAVQEGEQRGGHPGARQRGRPRPWLATSPARRGLSYRAHDPGGAAAAAGAGLRRYCAADAGFAHLGMLGGMGSVPIAMVMGGASTSDGVLSRGPESASGAPGRD
jgi:hypothetical protein